MASNPSKATSSSDQNTRKRSPEPTVLPVQGDLTQDRIDEFFDSELLTDRERVSWALQTECRERLAKLEAREPLDHLSTTLAGSLHLFNVYPGKPTESNATAQLKSSQEQLDMDLHAYSRKSHPLLRTGRDVDESFDTIHKLQFDENEDRHQRHPSHLRSRPPPPGIGCRPARNVQRVPYVAAPVPPNLLFFQIIMEAYLGYKWMRFHSPDPTVPRGAIMGGAVVAALTAWRDPTVLRLFQEAMLPSHLEQLSSPGHRLNPHGYFGNKAKLMRKLHDWFLHDDAAPQSAFCSGDVDIFLPVSPHTRSLVKCFQEQHGFSMGIRATIKSFLSGGSFGQSDLFRAAWILYHEERDLPKDTEFVHVVSNRALSSMLTDSDDDKYTFWGEREPPDRSMPWPRPTQLIMLSEMADLVGGLLDFDLSLCACAFDGNSVYVAPRAAFSLVTMAVVVTPFIMEEKRNWQRITKYYKRGFQPYVIDQNCRHATQCASGPFGVQEANESAQGAAAATDESRPHRIWNESWLNRPKVVSESNTFGNNFAALSEFQESNGRERICPCSPVNSIRYSIVAFEKACADPLEFLAMIHEWSDEKRTMVENIHAWRRVVCRACRRRYENYAFLKQNNYTTETVEDLIRGERVYRRGFHGLRPSFYSGGTFDSRRCRSTAYYKCKLLDSLGSQLQSEQTRYLLKHGTLDGHLPRYVSGLDLEDVFEEASETRFPEHSKNPIGLNPERFATVCDTCRKWIVDCEFGVKICEVCDPATRRKKAIA